MTVFVRGTRHVVGCPGASVPAKDQRWSAEAVPATNRRAKTGRCARNACKVAPQAWHALSRPPPTVPALGYRAVAVTTDRDARVRGGAGHRTQKRVFGERCSWERQHAPAQPVPARGHPTIANAAVTDRNTCRGRGARHTFEAVAAGHACERGRRHHGPRRPVPAHRDWEVTNGNARSGCGARHTEQFADTRGGLAHGIWRLLDRPVGTVPALDQGKV